MKRDTSELFQVFLKAVEETFRIQCGIQATHLKDAPHDFKTQITSILGVHSSHFDGLFSVHFSEKVLEKVMVRLLGDYSEKDERVYMSMVGELTNIIFGVAKRILNNEKGHDFQMAIPKLFKGDALYVHKSAGLDHYQAYYEMDGEIFEISLSIQAR